MIQLDSSTLEAKIVELLLEIYPITVEDLAKELHVKKSMVMQGLQSLQLENVVILEPLPDKTFVRLARHDISFIGRSATQKKTLKRKKGRRLQATEDTNVGYA